mmetsp:Transcript_18085/g.26779  ORF Transcript_18085/g.26779 Transcript_18085/m.26779 type:complete len:108 (-) Transcript_18085:34-357(-)
MSVNNLRRLGLSREVMEKFKANNLASCSDIFSKTELQLITMLDLNRSDVEKILDKIARKMTRRPTTAQAMLEQRAKGTIFLSTGLRGIDAAMKVKIPVKIDLSLFKC